MCSLVAQSNMLDTVVSHAFAMWIVSRRAFMLSWITDRVMCSMSVEP